MFTGVVPIIDAFRGLMPLPDGVVADDSASQPTKPHAFRLYCWPLRVGPQQLADEPQGRVPDPFLRIALLVTLGARGEPRVQKRDRDLSVALDGAVTALLASIFENRRHAPDEGEGLWWDAYTEAVVYDAVRQEDVRGHGVNVVLRLTEPI